MPSNKHRHRLKTLIEAALAEVSQVKPYDWVQAKLKYANLPSLLDNFCHAGIEEAIFGPRRELLLILRPLIWVGNQASYSSYMNLRFGGIHNAEEVKSAFTPQNVKRSELAYIRYDNEHLSKPGDLYIEAVFERISVSVTIHY